MMPRISSHFVLTKYRKGGEQLWMLKKYTALIS